MAFPEGGPQRGQAQGELSASRPQIPFSDGHKLGSQGSLIPTAIADAYVAFLALEKRRLSLSPEETAEYNQAAYRASSRDEEERGATTSAMEEALDAGAFIPGYVHGILEFLDRGDQDGPWLSPHESRISYSPAVISASVEGMRAYMVGHQFLKPPAYLDSANRVDGAGFSLAHDSALGFIVGAARVGKRVRPDEVPASEEAWEAFEYGRKQDIDYFFELISKGYGGHDVSALVSTYMLGAKIENAIESVAPKTDSV